jgi:hypothetical protein
MQSPPLHPEEAMNAATFLILVSALGLPQETPEALRAIEIVKKAGGTLVFDDKAPGKPVISLNL